MQTEPNWPGLIRPEISTIETSGIVEVFDYGRNKQGLIPLWVGEGDLPTPALHRRGRQGLASTAARLSTPIRPACRS